MFQTALTVGLLCLFFQLAAQNIDITWSGTRGQAKEPPRIKETSTPDGKKAVKAEPSAKGKWQGISGVLDQVYDLGQYSAIAFKFRQKIWGGRKMHVVLRIEPDQKANKNLFVYCNFQSGPGGKWQEHIIPFDPAAWKSSDKSAKPVFSSAAGISLYPFSALSDPGQYIEIGDVRLIPRSAASHKLPAAGYFYINRPSSGDPDSSVLTDGDPGRESQAVYREYSNDMSVVFDLGKQFYIDLIKLQAMAPGSHNFSVIRIFAGNQKDKFRAVGSISNHLSGGKEEHCKWEYRKPFVARYVKLEAVKPRPDFPVYLSEVSFSGRVPTAEERSKSLLESYDNGPEPGSRTDADTWLLSNQKLSCRIDRKTGMINGIFNNGRLLIEKLYHTVLIQTRQKDTLIDCMRDKVVKAVAGKQNITLEVTNLGLPGITLIKEYRLTADELFEKVTVKTAPGAKRYFLQLSSNCVLNRDFRKDGFYETWGDAHHLVREYAGDVTIPKNVCNMPVVSFENFSANLTLFHHLLRRNGLFEWLASTSEDTHRTAFTPNGYRLPLTAIVPADAPEQSVESRLDFAAGTLLNAYQRYRDLAEVRKFYSEIRRPFWLRDMKLHAATGWMGACEGGEEKIIGNYNRLLYPNGFITANAAKDLDSTWGEFPVSGRIFNRTGGYHTAEEIRASILKSRQICPFLKVSQYTWAWTSYDRSKAVRENPQWFVRHLRNGAVASWFPGNYRINYLRLMGNPAARNAIRDDLLKMQQYYQLDYWYLDGGHSGSFARDYDRMIQDDSRGWMTFYQDMRKGMQRVNPDAAVFFNVPGNPVGDFGFLESFQGAMTSSWRMGAAWMWKFKLFQYRDPLRYPCYIYWLPGLDGPLHNYLLGTGLLPAYNSRHFSARDIPFISARFEVRQLQLAEADVEPDWRRDRNTQLECMSQTQGNAGFVFIHQHGKNVSGKVAVNTVELGIRDSRKKVWMWFFRFRNGKNFIGKFGERDIAAQYRKNQFRPERAVVPEFLGSVPWQKRLSAEFQLGSGEAGLWMITQTPAAVWSINDLPSHFRLPSVPGVSIEGNHDRLTVVNEFEKIEIAVLVPEGKIIRTAAVNGKSQPVKLVRDHGVRFALISLTGRGRSSVEMKYEPAPRSNAAASFELAGNHLKLKSSGPVLWEISKDGASVWSGQGPDFALDLKGAVENGNYLLTAAGLDGSVIRQDPFSLSGAAVPSRVDKPFGHFKVINSVKKVNVVSRCGIPVTSVCTAWSDGVFDTRETFADPETLQLHCATVPQMKTGWSFGAAGLEIRSKRYLCLELQNKMKDNNGLFPGVHAVKYDDPQCLAGLILDFGTSAGYSFRSVASFGLQHEKRSSADPCWGRNAKPDSILVVNNMIREHKTDKEIIWLDLADYGAPVDWDGRLFINLAFGNIAPYRKFGVKILGTSDVLPAGKKTVVPTVISGTVKKKKFSVSQISGAPQWEKIPVLGLMHSIVPGKKIQFPVKVQAAFDEQHFYLRYSAAIRQGQQLTPGRSGNAWNGDAFEFYLQNPADPDRMFHCIVDCAGNFMVFDSDHLKRPGFADRRLASTPVKAAFDKKEKVWHAELTLPWSFFKTAAPQGKTLSFNAMCDRINAEGNLECFMLAPGTKYFAGDALRLEFK